MFLGPHRRPTPELRQIVREASQSLVTLDAARLEELALCCEALTSDLKGAHASDRVELVRQAAEATSDMAVLARVLEATRANVQVMRRIRELRSEGLEYPAPVLSPRVLDAPEKAHGID